MNMYNLKATIALMKIKVNNYWKQHKWFSHLIGEKGFLYGM